MQLNDIQEVCKIDLERRQLFTTIKQSSSGILYFPTNEGNFSLLDKIFTSNFN